MVSGPNSARANKSPSLSLIMHDDDIDDEEEKDDEAEEGVNKLTVSQRKREKAAVIRKKL